MKRQHLVIIYLLFLILIILPPVFAFYAAGKDFVFGGVMANPIDGQSYLAKMKEGWNGEWLFRLPYSPNPGVGQPIFLFYIFLGFLSKGLNIPIDIFFHLARVAAALFLAWTLYRLAQKSLGRKGLLWGMLFMLFGSGMGWLLLFFWKEVPVDFFVAEMYPFLSSYTNPHFPLGLGLLIWILIKSVDYENLKDAWIIFLLGIVLSIVLPFGIVNVLCNYGVYFIWSMLEKERRAIAPILALLSGGGLYLLYQFIIIRTDPALSLWDKQNITSAPNLLNLVMGLAPLILVLTWGMKSFIKAQLSSYQKILLIWIVCGLILTFIPFNLQRRFLTGLYIPVAILTVFVVDKANLQRFKKKIVFNFILMLSVISNLLLLVMGFSAITQKNNTMFLSVREYRSLNWLKEHSDKEDIILASPELSLFIPNIAERRVVYGHPFETIDADKQKANVIKYFSGSMDPQEKETFFRDNRIRYVLFVSEDDPINVLRPEFNQGPIYEEDGVKIFEIK